MLANSSHSVILATDLDGTFLGGSERQKAEFYQYIQANRDRILLVFVTGRELDITFALYDDPNFPIPDYIIGDIGTTIVEGKTGTPITSLQDWVAKIWDDSNEKVKALLAEESGIKLQSVVTKYRVAYYYRPELLQASTLEKIVNAGYDYILSSDRYLDIMPKGISKGPTLLKFIEEMNLDAENAIACGDTLNDLSLFETGLKAVAMGNSEPKLIEKIRHLDNVYMSSHPGVMAIWDGLKFYEKA
ncbi:MAG: HAD-IIB family hydrolase [Cyanobacteria bacterium P01_E01_bin.42]